jgi:hypothetical protein
MEGFMLWAMVKVAWLATIIHDHCSSLEDEYGGWMLVWPHRHELKMECIRQRYIFRIFYYTDLRLSR